MKTQRYALWVDDQKWLGNMKRWQAYYMAFHVWVVLRSAGNRSRVINVTKEAAL